MRTVSVLGKNFNLQKHKRFHDCSHGRKASRRRRHGLGFIKVSILVRELENREEKICFSKVIPRRESKARTIAIKQSCYENLIVTTNQRDCDTSIFGSTTYNDCEKVHLSRKLRCRPLTSDFFSMKEQNHSVVTLLVIPLPLLLTPFR